MEWRERRRTDRHPDAWMMKSPVSESSGLKTLALTPRLAQFPFLTLGSAVNPGIPSRLSAHDGSSVNLFCALTGTSFKHALQAHTGGGARACANGGRSPRHVGQGGGREPAGLGSLCPTAAPAAHAAVLCQLRTPSRAWGGASSRPGCGPAPARGTGSGAGSWERRERRERRARRSRGRAELDRPRAAVSERGFRRPRRISSSAVVPGHPQVPKREGSSGCCGLAALPLAVSSAGGAPAKLP